MVQPTTSTITSNRRYRPLLACVLVVSMVCWTFRDVQGQMGSFLQTMALLESSGEFEGGQRRQVESTSDASEREQADRSEHQTPLVPPPFDCRAFLEKVRSGAHSLEPMIKPNSKEGNLTVTTMTKVPFLLSLHPPSYDSVRAFILKKKRYYEKNLDAAYDAVLDRSPSGSIVIDVGGNIGYYAMLPASLGDFQIHTFEPKDENVLRICESIEYNQWDTISSGSNNINHASSLPQKFQVNQFGISNENKVLRFLENKNPGAGKVIPDNVTFNLSEDTKVYQINVRTLDSYATQQGWFESKPNIAVLKIDIERHEAPAVLGATKLLESGIVRNVFVETSLEGIKDPDNSGMAALQLLVKSGYRAYKMGSWLGPGTKVPWPTDDNLANHLREKLISGSAHYYNLWWTNDPAFTVEE